MKARRPKSPSAAPSAAALASPPPRWHLRLYITGQTPRSAVAFANLKAFCEGYLKGRYRITTIDLLQQPHLAKGDQILAVPTVVRRLPRPVRKIIGDISETARMLVGLDLQAAK